MDTPRVGFVGLGAMGSRMASRLVDAGYAVVVHNRTRTREAEVVHRGATPASSPREVAARTDIVVGCLLDDDAIRQVYLGEAGMAAAGPPGPALIGRPALFP